MIEKKPFDMLQERLILAGLFRASRIARGTEAEDTRKQCTAFIRPHAVARCTMFLVPVTWQGAEGDTAVFN